MRFLFKLQNQHFHYTRDELVGSSTIRTGIGRLNDCKLSLVWQRQGLTDAANGAEWTTWLKVGWYYKPGHPLPTEHCERFDRSPLTKTLFLHENRRKTHSSEITILKEVNLDYCTKDVNIFLFCYL